MKAKKPSGGGRKALAKRAAKPPPRARPRPQPQAKSRPQPPAPRTAAAAPAPEQGMILPKGRGRQREAIRAETRAFPRMKPQAVPRAGWIRAIRDALGISQSQIAARVGVSRATVQQWERSEARRRITVHSLDQVASAMGCTVALAIVPKVGTLDDVRRRQARAKAIAIVKKEDAPEDPDAVTDLTAAQLRRVDRIVARLLRGSPRRLWKP
ncbi:MAG: helix-turn-helix domain-containing protein [Steroidobacteraceae bacterium]|nr:helix-turn-helix domain-containing protein [Steroidobacteraceae bacterium]